MSPTRVFLVLLALTAAPACAKRSVPISSEPRDDGGPPLDTDVMAYLSEARALHHQANLREDARDLPGAIAPLLRLVHARRPHEPTLIPEVEEVLADTFARLADLRTREGDSKGAEADVQAGLGHAADPTYFRGHLLEVSGIIDEQRAARLVDAGRTAEAEEARARARDRLNEAVRVQEGVLSRSTSDAGTSGAAR